MPHRGISNFDPKADPDELFFRAVSTDGERKGLRLERVFWGILERAAAEQSMTLADIVKLQSENGNLSSHMRTYAAKWALKNIESLRLAASFNQFARNLNACTSPAFAISVDKKLRAFNPAFLQYVRRHLPTEDVESTPRNLRLQIDTAANDLIAQLKADTDAVVVVGFTFGINERRVRGRLNAILAPVWNEELIAAYVIE